MLRLVFFTFSVCLSAFGGEVSAQYVEVGGMSGGVFNMTHLLDLFIVASVISLIAPPPIPEPPKKRSPVERLEGNESEEVVRRFRQHQRRIELETHRQAKRVIALYVTTFVVGFTISMLSHFR